MKEWPIIFSTPMVRVILAGSKSQTRRIVGPSNGIVDGHKTGKRAWDGPDGAPLDLDAPHVFVDDGPSPAGNPGPYMHVPRTSGDSVHRVYPIWAPGDRLWVREAWRVAGILSETPLRELNQAYRHHLQFKADDDQSYICQTYRNPMFMPRWASRITLEITRVRAERLQGISEADAIAEGITGPHDIGYRAFRLPGDSKPRYSRAEAAYEALWESIHGSGTWSDDPWVWVIEFRRTTP